MRNLSLLCLLAAFFSTSASAGFLIDPYIGTGHYKSTADLSALEESETITASGARVGYSFLLFSAGVDYQMASVDGSDSTNTSIFVGVDMPILVRAWAEFFVSSDVEGDVEFKDGTSIGLGFTGLPFVSLNVELQNINYEAELLGAKYDVKTAATVFSISLPLDL